MELEWFSINILIIVVASITIIFTLTTMISMIEILGCQELETLQGVRCFRRISDVGRQLGQFCRPRWYMPSTNAGYLLLAEEALLCSW